MKIRCSFVTNSSSSNVILALKAPLSIGAVRSGLLNLEYKNKEMFDVLVKDGDSLDFAAYLTGFACGHSIDRAEEHERNVVNHWRAYWQAETERFVQKFGEDAAFVKEMECWDRVHGDDKSWPEPKEPGKFPKRAFALKAEGYTFVYMFDINDFSGEDVFMTRLAEWAGSIKTDNFVLEVETYY